MNQAVIDACFSTTLKRPLSRLEMQRQQMRNRERIVQNLMTNRLKTCEWSGVANTIEQVAEAQDRLDEFGDLIKDLRTKQLGKRCQARAAIALQNLWGMS